MARKGLSKEKIIEASIKFIQEKGYENFSIRELAIKGLLLTLEVAENHYISK